MSTTGHILDEEKKYYKHSAKSLWYEVKNGGKNCVSIKIANFDVFCQIISHKITIKK